MPRISASDRQCSGFAMSSGTASSDVARNTASRVPSVTTLLRTGLPPWPKTRTGAQAQYGARYKAKAPAARQCFFDALRVAVLHIFDQPVRREQKGQHFHAVQQRVQ